MANEKKYEIRQQQKIDIEANWLKATNFIPKNGEIIVYDAETADTDFTGTGRALPITYARVKIGDGVNNVNDLPFLHGVGVETELGGEIFGDYVNNKADLRGHAEGDFTEAGWRAHAEGYLTKADNTGHSEGRCTSATGNGSHAEGAEAYINLYYIGTKNPVVTAASFHIDKKEVEIKGDPGLQVGDIVNFAPNDVATGFKSTDIKRIVDVRRKNGEQSLNQIYYYETKPATVSGNEIEVENFQESKGIIQVGDYASFDDGNTLYLITEIIYPEEGSITQIKVSQTPGIAGSNLSVYRNQSNTIITLNDSFRANNYYPGWNAPEDGYIPAGATVKKAQGSKAEAQGSHAEGSGSQATAAHSHAEGYSTTASNTAAHSEGNKSTASGVYSHAEGNSTTSSGNSAHTEGYKTTASGIYSHAQGNNSVASEECAHAGGKNSEASASHAFAHGYAAKAKGTASGAMGSSVNVTGNYSFAQGLYLEATGKSQHVIGQYNDPDDSQAFIVGYGDNTSKRKNVHTVDKKGNAVFTGEVTASNGRLISEDEARALIPEVDNSEEWYIISGDFSFGEEGQFITVDETKFHESWPKVMVVQTNEKETDYRHIYMPLRDSYEMPRYYFINGQDIIYFSVWDEDAISEYDLGFEVTETEEDWHVITMHLDEMVGETIENCIIGYRDEIVAHWPKVAIHCMVDNHEEFINGNYQYIKAATIYLPVSHQKYNDEVQNKHDIYYFSSDKKILEMNIEQDGVAIIENKDFYIYETHYLYGSDKQLSWQFDISLIEKHWPKISINAHNSFGLDNRVYTPDNRWADEEYPDYPYYIFTNDSQILQINGSNGAWTLSDKNNDSSMSKVNPTGTGSLSLNRKSGTAVGKNSVAVGSGTTASALDTFAAGQNTQALKTGAFAEGVNSIAGGGRSHAEGFNTKTYGWNSHAEGNGSITGDPSDVNLGTNAHAEGYYTLAHGPNTHAEGFKTAAYGNCQHVQGRYNVHDTEENYAHIVGWGEENKPKNIHTLDKNGNAWFTGNVYIGSNSGTNRDDGSKKLATEEYVNNIIGDIEAALDNIITIQEGLINVEKLDEIIETQESLINQQQDIQANTSEGGE